MKAMHNTFGMACNAKKGFVDKGFTTVETYADVDMIIVEATYKFETIVRNPIHIVMVFMRHDLTIHEYLNILRGKPYTMVIGNFDDILGGM